MWGPRVWAAGRAPGVSFYQAGMESFFLSASDSVHSTGVLTSELQSSQLKGDKPISNFNQVNKSIEVI